MTFLLSNKAGQLAIAGRSLPQSLEHPSVVGFGAVLAEFEFAFDFRDANAEAGDALQESLLQVIGYLVWLGCRLSRLKPVGGFAEDRFGFGFAQQFGRASHMDDGVVPGRHDHVGLVPVR